MCTNNGSSLSELIARSSLVKVGECEFTRGTPVVSYGVGSCLLVSIFDVESGVGGVLHALLPSRDAYPFAEDDSVSDYQFVYDGILALEDELTSLPDVSPENLRAFVAGGTENKDTYSSLQPVDAENIRVARETFSELGIEIEQWEVGGGKSRTVIFDPDCEMLITRFPKPKGKQNE